jgi:hypothetical protein
MKTYYLNVEPDGFGEWEGYPQYKIDEAINVYIGIATREIEAHFPRTIVETTMLSGQNNEDSHPDFEFIDDFLSKNWTDWLEMAIYEVDFGFVIFKNQKYILKEPACQSSRVMNEYPQSLQYQGDGDTYMVEYQASGFNQKHKDILVTWHFEICREGIENIPEGAYSNDVLEEDYDWDDVYKVEQR